MNLRIDQLSERTLTVFSVIWAITVVTGLLLLFQYQTTAGANGSPAAQWPALSRISHETGHAHLIIAAHPRCPCTRATMEALARLLSHTQEKIAVTVLFLKPRGMPTGWELTDLWRTAVAIPGVQVVCDEGGDEARRFGLETSGHSLLFDRAGQQIFNGGITAGRGHHGDNAGLDSCMALINGTCLAVIDGSSAAIRQTPVYGCALRVQSSCEPEGTGLCQEIN